MTNTYDTSNEPLGSTAVKVLYNNASNLDDAVNSDSDTWVDRPPFGRIRRTWRGMENAFDQFLLNSGYEFIGDYDTDGPLTITRANQIFSKDGEYWRPGSGLVLPYTTVDNWAVDQPKFVSTGDASLRQELGGGVRRVQSVSELEALLGRFDKDCAILIGYYADTPGIGGGKVYWDATSIATADTGTVFLGPGGPGVPGRWVRPSSPEPRLSWFGVRHDDSDETTRIQAAASAFAGTGAVLVAENNKLLRITGPVSFFDVSLFLNNSTLTCAHVGNKCLMQMKGRAGVNNGTLIQAGTAVGDLGLAGQRIIFALDVHDCSYSNLKFECGAFGHAPFNLIGDVYNVKVGNIHFGTGPWAMGLIIHWATVDDSAALDYAVDITYLAGASNATTHPRNIYISNLRGDTFNGSGNLVALLYLSGAYDITASNFGADQVAKIFTVQAGDYGSDFAPAEIKPLIGNAIVLNNPSCLKLTSTSGGGSVSGQGFLNSVPAVSRLAMDVTINNPQLSTELTGTRYGLFVDNCSGVKVFGGSITKFSTNVFWQRNITGGLLDTVRITQARDVGVLLDSDADKVRGVTIRRCQIYGNNTSGVVLPTLSGIRIANSIHATVDDCRFGQPGVVETQQHSVYVAAGCDDIKLLGNHTFTSAQTSAYAGDVSGGQWTMRLWDIGNTADTVFTTSPSDHVWSQPIGFGLRRTIINSASVVPAAGTHKQGDEVIFRNPAAGGSRGAICTTAGTPGTWKTFGAIAA